jgi:hypothetical protein
VFTGTITVRDFGDIGNITERRRALFVSICFIIYYSLIIQQPIPVAVGSKAWVYGRSLDGIVVSNPAEDIEVYLLRFLL